jgi:nucleolar protein 58
LLPEEVEAEVKAAAEISMGTEVSEEDICNILHLCTQVNYAMDNIIKVFLAL